MAWWELRLHVDADAYDLFSEELVRLVRARFGNRPQVGVEAHPERCELLVSTAEREELGPVMLWAYQTYPSAQIMLMTRCYRTTDQPEIDPARPWAQRCQCPTGSHPGQTSYPPPERGARPF